MAALFPHARCYPVVPDTLHSILSYSGARDAGGDSVCGHGVCGRARFALRLQKGDRRTESEHQKKEVQDH